MASTSQAQVDCDLLHPLHIHTGQCEVNSGCQLVVACHWGVEGATVGLKCRWASGKYQLHRKGGRGQRSRTIASHLMLWLTSE